MDERDYAEYLDPREAAREARRDREHPVDGRPNGHSGGRRGGRDTFDTGASERRGDDRGRRPRDRIRPNISSL